MAGKIKIDGIDKIIIKRLVEDARTPILSIAREVGISGAAIHQRLRKLENSNLMAGSKLILNPKSIRIHNYCFCWNFFRFCSDVLFSHKKTKTNS